MTIERPVLVSGNPHKVADFTRMLMPHLPFDVQDLNIDESQGPDREQIITAKAKAAYAFIGRTVIVDDTAAGLETLNGLPGPYIKQFEAAKGEDVLWKLATEPSKRAAVTSTIALYDGQTIIIGKGDVHGMVVPPRGDNSYGFDKVFVPDGQTKTIAEMTLVEKDAVSERNLAVQDLLSQLAIHA